MCDSFRIYYFKIPNLNVSVKKTLTAADFGGDGRTGSIAVTGGKTYAFEAKVDPGAYLRLDFFNPQPVSPKTFLTNLWQDIQIGFLLLREGSTSAFFEKKRFVKKIYNDINLPGEAVALSVVAKVGDQSASILVIGRAPADAKFAIVSIAK